MFGLGSISGSDFVYGSVSDQNEPAPVAPAPSPHPRLIMEGLCYHAFKNTCGVGASGAAGAAGAGIFCSEPTPDPEPFEL